MKNFKTILMLVTAFILIVTTSSECSDFRDYEKLSKGTSNTEQQMTERNQSRLLENQPPVQLNWSLERENINRRTKLFNDKNKVSYIYLLSDMGTIIAYFPLKGKVSSVNSQITNTEQLKTMEVDDQTGIGCAMATLPSPSEDGSYGTNGDAVFFFLTDGTYCEWAGKYFLCDKPIKLTQKPVMTYNVKQ